MHVAAPAVDEPSLSIPGALAQDIDHAVHGVGAPNRRARTADYFDPIHIIEEHLLGIPKDS
jgi:hypothetical protein